MNMQQPEQINNQPQWVSYVRRQWKLFIKPYFAVDKKESRPSQTKHRSERWKKKLG